MLLFIIVILLLLPYAFDGPEKRCLNCHICHKPTVFCSLPGKKLFPAQGIFAACPARKI